MWLIDAALLPALEKALQAQLNGAAVALSMPTGQGSAYQRDGATAYIEVSGLLTAKPNIIAQWMGMGNTTYTDINNALIAAEDDSKVKSIVLNIDSGGGEFAGFYSVVETMKLIDKPVTAAVGNLAASAAYGIASQADKIVATSKAASFGSIGVAVDAYINDNVVSLASTNAPEKRPDASTDEGKAAIVARLDELHDLFVGAISEGRDVDKDKVNADYGRGATMLAERALKHGMIDSIATQTKRTEETMDLETLRSEHASLYAQVQNEGAVLAADKATEDERSRVNSLLELAAEAGDASLAVEHINSGAEVTPEIMKSFIGAAKQSKFAQDRADDNPDYNAENPDGVDPVLAALAERMGVQLSG